MTKMSLADTASKVKRPKALPVKPEGIPAELKAIPQWVMWKYVWNPNKKRKDGSGEKGEWDKPLFNVRTGKHASSTDPRTWCDFDTALSAYKSGEWDGIGFVPTPEDELVITDIDHRIDPNTGAIDPWAARIVGELDSYTERSPSACGLRNVAHGRKPDRERSKNGDIEMYDGLTKEGKPGGRYLTFTGHRLKEAQRTIHRRQNAITSVYERELKTPPAASVGPEPSANGHAVLAIGDDELIEKAKKANR